MKRRNEKLGKANQMNLIEMISALYCESFTINDMAKRLNKSRRTVYRFISLINSFTPIIFTYVDVEKRVHLKLNKKFSEKSVEHAFVNRHQAPLVYVFLKSLVKPVYIAEIQKALKVTQRAVIKIIQSIADCSPYGTFADWDFEKEGV